MIFSHKIKPNFKNKVFISISIWPIKIVFFFENSSFDTEKSESIMTNKVIFTRWIGRFFSFFLRGRKINLREIYENLNWYTLFFLNFALEIRYFFHWKEEKILHKFFLKSFDLVVRYRAQSEMTENVTTNLGAEQSNWRRRFNQNRKKF